MFKKLLLHPTNHVIIQMIRYGLVVAVAAPIDVGGYIWLAHYMPVVLAATISFSLSTIVNYFLSVWWVFSRRSHQQKRRDAIMFIVIGLVGLGLTDLIVWLLNSGFQVQYIAAKLAALVVVFFWNFGARRILFHGWGLNDEPA